VKPTNLCFKGGKTSQLSSHLHFQNTTESILSRSTSSTTQPQDRRWSQIMQRREPMLQTNKGLKQFCYPPTHEMG